MHVDDFLFSDTPNFEKTIIDRIAEKYKVGKRQANNFNYVGLTISLPQLYCCYTVLRETLSLVRQLA